MGESSTRTNQNRPPLIAGTWQLGRKDYLYRNVYNMRRSKGEAFDFVPRFFILPRDYDEYQQDLERNPDRMYIQKVWGVRIGGLIQNKMQHHVHIFTHILLHTCCTWYSL